MQISREELDKILKPFVVKHRDLANDIAEQIVYLSSAHDREQKYDLYIKTQNPLFPNMKDLVLKQATEDECMDYIRNHEIPTGFYKFLARKPHSL